jgi:photosystem II stability/assembly factor-like uncharacterized protein
MKKYLFIGVGATAALLMALAFWYEQGPETLRQPVVETKGPNSEPNDWIGRQKLYPHTGFNHGQYLYALRQAAALHASESIRSATWENAGPYNVGGRITDIAIHPSQPNTVYLGAASGGILKTTDGGTNWQNVFASAPVISIGALAISPGNPDVLWAGTGEANSSSFSFIGNGIYKSTDGGNTWVHKGLEQTAYFGRIVVDYSNNNRVFAAATGTLFTPNTERGIFRSTNGGDTWERILYVSDSTSGIDLVQHPSNPDILYAAMWERMRGLLYRRSYGPTSGIFKSTDGGDTWSPVNTGLPAEGNMGRIGLAIANNNPDRLYAFVDMNNFGTPTAKVFRSDNGALTWESTNDWDLAGMNSNFGWYFGQIRVDPLNDNRIYVLGVDMFRSDDGGNSYIQIAGYYNIDQVYVDHHAHYTDPASGKIWHGCDGGLYTSMDFGNTWTKTNNLPLTQFYAIEVDYQLPHRIYGGTQDNNTIGTRTGAVDGWDRILGGDGFYVKVDPTNSNVIYAEYQWGNLHKSTDGGYNFYYIANYWSGERTNWSSPLAMSQDNTQTLYFGTYRVWKTINGGNSWTPVSGDLTRGLAGSGYSTLTTLAVSPLNSAKVMAGSDDGRVHISPDYGNTWTDVTQGLPNRWITRVAFDAFDENTVYVTVSGFRWDEPHPYVFRSMDLGQNWEPIQANLPELPVNVIVQDPGKQGRLIVGTDAGIFYTENNGQEWMSLQAGMPQVPVTDLKIHHPTRTLIAGTYGCSAWKLDLGLLTGIGNQQHQGSNGLVIEPVFPNPIGGQHYAMVQAGFYLARSGYCRAEVFNAQGRQVARLIDAYLQAGTHHLRWAADRTPGTYFIRILCGKEAVVQKILVL